MVISWDNIGKELCMVIWASGKCVISLQRKQAKIEIPQADGSMVFRVFVLRHSSLSIYFCFLFLHAIWI